MQLDILVINCSVFNPTPSLAAAVINQFRLKPTIITYNLSGMGCSAGLLSIALVQELLQVQRRQSLHSGLAMLGIVVPLVEAATDSAIGTARGRLANLQLTVS